MTRFSWVPWGLLVVVVDLPLRGWDVLPDVVGYAWLVAGLVGAERTHPAFVRARAASAAGVVPAVVTGTPLLAVIPDVLLIPVLLVDAVVFAAVVHQLATGLRHTAGRHDASTELWATRLQYAAAAAGGVAVLTTGLSPVLPPLYLLGQIALALLGFAAVALTYRSQEGVASRRTAA